MIPSADFEKLTRFMQGHNNAMDALKEHYPEVHQRLEKDGYEFAGSNVVGRCQGDCTLFLELNHQSGTVLGWVWDVKKEEFVGMGYQVFGPLGPALEEARHLVESTFAQDHLSGDAARYKEQRLEQVHVG